MRKSKVLAKLRAGRPVRCCGLGSYMPFYVRLAAHCGFDCIWLDLEHRAMDQREIQALLAVFHQYDIDCMLRAPTLEKTKLYRYLEDGATGLMIPHVSTPEKAQMLVQSMKFPPMGDRGIDGAGLDSDYYLQGGGDYTQLANQETFLAVQIETPEAVRNVDAIAATPGVDIMFVGPGDLGMRLKHAPETEFDMEEALRRVNAAAQKHGKTWGQPAGTRDALQKLYDQGARFLNHGGEFIAVLRMLEECGRTFDDVYGEA